MMKTKISRKFQSKHRMIRNQLSSLFLYGQIKTTQAKSKMVKNEMQKLISSLKKAKGPNLERKASSILYGGASKKAIDVISEIESVSVYNLPPRRGDGASLAIVMLNKKNNKSTKQKSEVKSKSIK